jgi:hypothetical protein
MAALQMSLPGGIHSEQNNAKTTVKCEKQTESNYKANTVLDKPLITLNEIMLLWLFLVLPFPYLIYTCSYLFLLLPLTPHCYRPGVLCPIRPPVADGAPQTLPTPCCNAEFRAFCRHWAALAAGDTGNDETGGKRNTGSEPCPLHQVLCFVNLGRVGKRFKAGFRSRGRDDLHA